ncbi:MAG: hypothetical protein FJW23_08580 [Acidimicrobiia bacterium]|nr:hypothetical protein [Acidimicrobiia bacterium]
MRASICTAAVLLSGVSGSGVLGQPSPAPLLFTELYTEPFGEAAVRETPLAMTPAAGGGETSATMPAVGLTFQRMSPDDFGEWHPTPQPKFSLTLTGAIDIEVTGGRRVRVGPGNILYPGDSIGKGHRNHPVGEVTRTSAQVLQEAPEACRDSQYCVGVADGGTVSVTRVSVDATGRMRATPFDRPSAEVSRVAGMRFLRMGEEEVARAPHARQYAIVLRGGGELTAGDGRVAFASGTVLVFEGEQGPEWTWRAADRLLLALFPLADPP